MLTGRIGDQEVVIVGDRFCFGTSCRHRIATCVYAEKDKLEQLFKENDELLKANHSGEEDWEALAKDRKVAVRKLVALNNQQTDVLTGDKSRHVKDIATRVKAAHEHIE